MSLLPHLQVTEWLNCDKPLLPADFQGRVVAVEAFQMLCPACVSHGLPQATRIRATFRPEDVLVIGLHTVFEHHAAMTPVALRAFLHEYRIRFPVAVDEPGSGQGPLPYTMAAWALEGTPSLVLFDRQSQMRGRYLGAEPDMTVGALIMSLVNETP